jgi:hypothetical protein
VRSLNTIESDTAIGELATSPVEVEAIPPTVELREWTGIRRALLSVFPFQVVLTIALMVLIFVMARHNIADPDIWWHLRNADYLWTHHLLPRVDMYSFTVPGHPWINHEWLSEVPYYLAWRAFGLAGVNSVMLALLGAIFLGLLNLCYQETRNFKASVLACAFGVFLATVSFGPRTILPGYLCMVCLLTLLQRFRLKGRAPLWLVPPLFCLWINLHGSWLLGMVVFSILIASGFVRGQWGIVEAEEWTRTQKRALAVTWLASIAALFVNPFGYRLVFYPFDLAFRQKLNIAHVAEWVSVDFHQVRGKLVLLMLAVLLLSALLRRMRWTLAEVALLLFALYSGLTYIRFLFLLAMVSTTLLAKLLDFVPPYRREMETPIVNTIVVLLTVSALVWFWPRSAELEQVVAKEYPTQIVPFLREHPPQGRVLNHYLWGGYIGWRDPDMKVFIDSRVDIFEYSGALQDYLNLLAFKNPSELLDKYQIRYVLFPPSEPLTYLLQHDPEWKVIYSDSVSVLLERSSAVQQLAHPR